MKTSILTTLSLCLLYLCISYSQPLSSTCKCGSSDDACWDYCLYYDDYYGDDNIDSNFSESNALPCGLIRTCPKYLQHPRCKDVPTTIPGRCSPTPTPSTGHNEVCASKAEITKYIFDCQQQGSQEVSYSLEKMKSCLEEKLFFEQIYEQYSQDSTDEMVCAKSNDVLNRIDECKISSNNIYGFKDCLLKIIWPRPPTGSKPPSPWPTPSTTPRIITTTSPWPSRWD